MTVTEDLLQFLRLFTDFVRSDVSEMAAISVCRDLSAVISEYEWDSMQSGTFIFLHI